MANKKSAQDDERRIMFKPVKSVKAASSPEKEEEVVAVPESVKVEEVEQPPQPAEEAVKVVKGAESWRAVASAPGEEPLLPALSADERQILVAQRALIWLPVGEGEQDSTDSDHSHHFNRLLKLVSLLSDAFPLPKLARLVHQQEGHLLISLLPQLEANQSLSHVYDRVAEMARLVQGELYIGAESTFVQYRDARAPRGYDVPDFAGTSSSSSLSLKAENLRLIGRQGCQQWPLQSFKEQTWADFCLQVSPRRQAASEPVERFYLLSPAPLYTLLGAYLRRHELSYQLTHLSLPSPWGRGE